MARKRSASNDLNHTNWDNDEEPEDEGAFKIPSETVLQNKNFKTTKRRNLATSTSTADGDNNVLFKSASFAFLNDLLRTVEPSKNGLDDNISIVKQSNVANSPMLKIPETKAQNTEKDDEYYDKLKGLNESVSKLIKRHVDTNPFINLEPIFKDYERYFDELEKLRTDKALDEKNRTQLNSSMAKTSTSEELSSVLKSELSSFLFKYAKDTEIVASGKTQLNLSTAKSSTSEVLPSSSKSELSSFLIKSEKDTEIVATTSMVASSTPTFSFSPNAKTASGFIFGGAHNTPFTLTNESTPNTERDKETEDNGEDF